MLDIQRTIKHLLFLTILYFTLVNSLQHVSNLVICVSKKVNPFYVELWNGGVAFDIINQANFKL